MLNQTSIYGVKTTNERKGEGGKTLSLLTIFSQPKAVSPAATRKATKEGLAQKIEGDFASHPLIGLIVLLAVIYLVVELV